MRRMSARMAGVLVILLCAVLSGLGGCNRDVTGEVATLSGTFLGDVVAVVATGYLHNALGIESSGSADESAEDEHSHAAEALHDHEH